MTTPLPATTRTLYGLGMAADGVKNNAFAVFLLFYYQQVIGLHATWTGIALFLALCVDAVTDPIAGVLSDRTRHRWGRRHPWMFAAPVPLSICYLAVFSPPDNASQPVLFAWLLLTSVGTRVSMTAFAVPHAALGAELATGYNARSSLMSLRTGFGWVFGLLNAWLAYTVFLSGTADHPFGLMNPEGYTPFAWFGASVLLIATTLSALGTLGSTPDSPPPVPQPLGTTLATAFRLRPYRQAVVGGVFFAAAFGLSENLANYINTYVWRLTSDQLASFVFAIGIAAVVATAAAEPLAARLSKHRLAMLSVSCSVVLLQGAIALRAYGVLPDAQEPGMLPILLAIATLAYTGFILCGAMIPAMIADCTDAMAAEHGDSQGGLLFAASSFVSKATTGLGTLLAGQVVALAGLQANAAPTDVAPDVVMRLATLSAGGGVVLSLGACWAWSSYTLDRAALEALQRASRTGPSH